MARPLEDLIEIATVQERELKWSAFDEGTAWSVGNRVRSLFLERKNAERKGYEKASITISITLFNGQILFQSAVGSDTKPDNWDWIRRKSNVTKRFGCSSFLQGHSVAQLGHQLGLTEKAAAFAYYHTVFGTGEQDYAMHGGAFPILIRGLGSQPIGVIAVSGLPEADDHQLVVDAIRAEIGSDGGSTVV